MFVYLVALSGVARPGPGHDIGRRTPVSQLVGHETHVRINVPEEMLVALAQVVQARLVFRAGEKTVFRALAVTGEQYGAGATTGRQAIAF